MSRNQNRKRKHVPNRPLILWTGRHAWKLRYEKPMMALVVVVVVVRNCKWRGVTKSDLFEDVWKDSFSKETKAIAMVAAATSGHWRIPEKEPILEYSSKSLLPIPTENYWIRWRRPKVQKLEWEAPAQNNEEFGVGI